MSIEVVVLLVGQLLTAGAIYGGIRADLRAIHERVERLEDRLDKHSVLRVG